MPYEKTSDLPKGARKMPPFRQHVFKETFNSCHKAGKAESECFRIAYSAANKATKP
jgi:cation transport regulator ChaB